jgi:hypothetical protein
LHNGADSDFLLTAKHMLGNAAGRGPSDVNGSTVQIACALVHMSQDTTDH